MSGGGERHKSRCYAAPPGTVVSSRLPDSSSAPEGAGARLEPCASSFGFHAQTVRSKHRFEVGQSKWCSPHCQEEKGPRSITLLSNLASGSPTRDAGEGMRVRSPGVFGRVASADHGMSHLCQSPPPSHGHWRPTPSRGMAQAGYPKVRVTSYIGCANKGHVHAPLPCRHPGSSRSSASRRHDTVPRPLPNALHRSSISRRR